MHHDLLDLRDLIHENTGLFIRDWDLDSLKSAINWRMDETSCASSAEYYRLLGSQEASGDEWSKFIGRLSKSNFARQLWRARLLLELIEKKAIPKRPGDKIKIWSAGCANGEEPLTIAMALYDRVVTGAFDFEIQASDINRNAIENAKTGVYPRQKVELLPGEWVERFFVEVRNGGGAKDLLRDDRMQVVPEIRNKINWTVANLVNRDEIAPYLVSDVIICRNVFIYFSDSAIANTLRLFAKLMHTGAYLITDGGDHFTQMMLENKSFECLEFQNGQVWVKR